MFIELAEILVCPTCRPANRRDAPSGLVAMVGEVRERRVVDGWLGCPVCQTRYPIDEAAVRFGPALSPSDLDAPDLGLRSAALLALEAPGYVLIGQGLDSIAGELAGFIAGAEVVALTADGATTRGSVSRLIGVTDDRLPLRSGSLAGAVFLDAGPSALTEAARVLRPTGRLVVFEPHRLNARSRIEGTLVAAGLEPLAVQPEAIVAARPG